MLNLHSSVFQFIWFLSDLWGVGDCVEGPLKVNSCWNEFECVNECFSCFVFVAFFVFCLFSSVLFVRTN